jgi:hypothetical protein
MNLTAKAVGGNVSMNLTAKGSWRKRKYSMNLTARGSWRQE